MISLLLPTMYQRMSQAGSLDLNVRREVEGKGGQVDIAPDQRLGLKSTHTELRPPTSGCLLLASCVTSGNSLISMGLDFPIYKMGAQSSSYLVELLSVIM